MNLTAFNSVCWAIAVAICAAAVPCPAQSVSAAAKKPSVASEEKPPADSKVRTKYSVDQNGGVVFREGDDFSLKCDIYRPVPDSDNQQEQPTDTYPAIIAVHGGAWRTGSKVSMLRHGRAFAAAGYVVMAINYRHAPRHPFPAQIHDCKYAVRWLKANAKQYQVDPDRVGAFGYSAGGHLVCLLGTTDEKNDLEGNIPDELADFDSSVRCVSAGGAPCEFSWIGKEASTLKYWLGATRAESPDAYQNASPLTYVDATDAPVFLFHGQYDAMVPIDSANKLRDALLERNVEASVETALLSGHISTFSNILWARKSIRFFDRHLKSDNSIPFRVHQPQP